MKTIALFLAGWLVLSSVHAAVEVDLEAGLPYVRAKELPADFGPIQRALAKPHVILDLRNTSVDVTGARTIIEALATKPAPDVLRIVLIDELTSPMLMHAIASGGAGVITIGPKSPALVTDLSVDISADENHRAYEAFEKGTPLQTLVNSNPEKTRFDEAALARERANGNADPESPAGGSAKDVPNAAASAAQPKPTIAAPPVDLVLQRAQQLYHALIALKKIEPPAAIAPPQASQH